MKVLNKLIKDGNVAVLISPDYGSGWYSWNPDRIEILFDPALVNLVLAGKTEELRTFVELKYQDIFKGGIDDLEVEWIPEGREFRIAEYDGKEWIEYKDDVEWVTA